eukprot:851556-Rhodomonas_salina.3
MRWWTREDRGAKKKYEMVGSTFVLKNIASRSKVTWTKPKRVQIHASGPAFFIFDPGFSSVAWHINPS